MEIDLSDITSSYRAVTAEKHSRHAAHDRLKPNIFQYDYLALSTLVADIERLIAEVPRPQDRPMALDIGCGKSPYRELVEACGFAMKTLDIDGDSVPDYVGSIEKTELPNASADLVLCTQALEHIADPGEGLREIFRILRPGGHLIASAPHVWFYHPHPQDNWRFTQEGLVRLVVAAGFTPKKLLSQGGSVLSLFQVINFLIYGVLGKFGAPLYAIFNIIGKTVDRLIGNNLFCHNFAVLARKP